MMGIANKGSFETVNTVVYLCVCYIYVYSNLTNGGDYQ